MDRLSALEWALRGAALAQLAIAALNLFLVRIMKWSADLERLPLLINEVFRVHLLFITVTVASFAILSWRFARDFALGENSVALWLAAVIGFFWATRALMQWTHYSASHWQGDRLGTGLHWLLFLGYGSLGLLYLAIAFLLR